MGYVWKLQKTPGSKRWPNRQTIANLFTLFCPELKSSNVNFDSILEFEILVANARVMLLGEAESFCELACIKQGGQMCF
jgi:hypothetical protein